MTEYDLNDAQWCMLDLLMRARDKGVSKVNRKELLYSPNVPRGAAMKLTFAALTMPRELVYLEGDHDFCITDAGVSLYNLRFGKGSEAATATDVADSVICLPGPSHYTN